MPSRTLGLETQGRNVGKSAMKERRQHRRRVLPFVRSAVLELEGSRHIVAVADLSAEGAFLSTQVEVETGQRLRLKVVLPGESRDVQIDCRVVRRNATLDVKHGRLAGIGVHFEGLDPAIRRRLEAFAAESPTERRPPPKERFEYRLLEREEVEVDELNALGRDGWQMTAALSSPRGVQMILLRRL